MILHNLSRWIAEPAEPANVRFDQTASAGFLSSDDELVLVCMARGFCAELAQRGHDPQATWEALCDLRPDMIDHLRTIEGWAMLSAYVTGGAVVLRLPRTEDRD